MSETVRMTWLRIFLRVLSLGFLAAFVPWITLILLNSPSLAPGGSLAPMLRFQPYNANYESMMAAIHLVWAVMLWRASYDPARHALFIDFTIWANAAHGFVMLIATPIQKGFDMMVIESLPLFVIAAALWGLRPRQPLLLTVEKGLAEEREISKESERGGVQIGTDQRAQWRGALNWQQKAV